MRRLADTRFATRFFVGQGIDIGAGEDPLSLYGELFPRMSGLFAWDLAQGDAQVLAGVADASYDFVHSSHSLEHMRDPTVAMLNWYRVLKPGGHLVMVVPDEDLYEQGHFPSPHNPDHKWTLTINKARSWSPRSLNIMDLVWQLGDAAQVVKLELLDATYRYDLPRFDQTLTPIGECGIEVILRKRPTLEMQAGGRLPPEGGISKNDFERLTGYVPL